ncbi:MAG: segregation/condensation protein A [Oscillospiraceae bacterium]|nr:segregation/condensation protein A [Oscillospiraceae bacterium]
MDELKFHLDGVVKTKNEYTDFDGPLELILQLLSKNKIEIKDIRIALILEQYLDYLEQMKKLDLEIASEFVEMASHLMYIKAKTVLAGAEPVEEMDELKNSLEELQRRREYERIKLMADKLAKLADRGVGIYVKNPEPLGKEKGYRYAHDLEEMRAALLAILSREVELPGIPENFTAPAKLVYPIGEKSEEIMLKMKVRRRMKVSDIFKEASGRSELVASFIAVLELCRSGSILLTEVDGEFIAEAADENVEERGTDDGT